jgi:3-(3-hydroxy-phenyl)propionate hydroxylase
VRESLGIRLDDYGFDEPWLVLDARTSDESGFPKSNLQLCDPLRPTTFIHMGPGRLRWEFMLKPDEDPEQMLQVASLQTLLEPWQAMGAIEVERSAIYRFHGLVAKQWRDRRVFLAGDAAHQMPPFMGQGMCAGLRDAANLAWKLEHVLRSGSHQALFDSYQSERDPHVRYVIQRAIEMGRVVCTLDPEAAARRDAEMLAAPRIGAPAPLPGLRNGWLFAGTPSAGEMFPQPFDPEGGSRLDDRLGPGAWLLRRGGSALDSGEQLVEVNLESDLPEPLAAPLRAWLDTAGQSAVLVRPDRYVFGTGEPAELLQAYLGQGAAMPAPATCAKTTMAD